MSKLPNGYTFQMTPLSDWVGKAFDLPPTPIQNVASAEDCAVQTLARGGHFFTYYGASTSTPNNCWPKNPISDPGYSIIIPAGRSSYYVLQDMDFRGTQFDFGGVSTGAAVGSVAACAQLCIQTVSCVTAHWSSGAFCSFARPRSSVAESGIIYPPNLLALCMPTIQCAASQCGTTITDGCGGSLTCANCPPPAPTDCKPNPVSCTAEQCSITVFDNCNNIIQCPACPSSLPNPVFLDDLVTSHIQNSATTTRAIPSSSTPTTFAISIDQQSKSPNVGIIAGVAIGVVILFGAIGGYVAYNKRGKVSAKAQVSSSPPPPPPPSAIFDSNEKTALEHPRPSSVELFSVFVGDVDESFVEKKDHRMFASMAGAAVANDSRKGEESPAPNSTSNSHGQDLPNDVNLWSVDQTAGWIQQNGGSPEGVISAKAQKLTGRALLLLEVAEVLKIVEFRTVGDSLQFRDALNGLRARDIAGRAPPLAFISGGVAADTRSDGRTRTSVRTAAGSHDALVLGSVAQASGSAKNAAVLVGVKVAVGVPLSSSSSSPSSSSIDNENEAEIETEQDQNAGGSKGRVEVSIDCSHQLNIADKCDLYADFATKLLNSDAAGLDLASLCFIQNTSCWVIHVDVLVLAYTGNLLDEMFKAIRAALANTLIPKVTVEESAGHFEFDIADEETEELAGVDDIPCVITLYKIGNYHVIDPTPLEELCSDVQLTVAINRKGLPCAIHKAGSGSVDPSLLAEMIQDAKKHGLELFSYLDQEIAREKLRLSNLE
ncbi:UNVERIFIED_CONTAM: Exosome complex component RRP42 [Siphonaria sp. JEL0065]|nr:Exosome complex component RRP42 [Siphonaria sp. JEL0065]